MYGFKNSLRWLCAAALILGSTALDLSAQENPKVSADPFEVEKRLPLSSSTSSANQRYDNYREVAQQQIRERVAFEFQQRQLRAEWYEWIGYSPARPTVNGSYMSNGPQYFYMPARGQIVNTGMGRAWYW